MRVRFERARHHPIVDSADGADDVQVESGVEGDRRRGGVPGPDHRFAVVDIAMCREPSVDEFDPVGELIDTGESKDSAGRCRQLAKHRQPDGIVEAPPAQLSPHERIDRCVADRLAVDRDQGDESIDDRQVP